MTTLDDDDDYGDLFNYEVDPKDLEDIEIQIPEPRKPSSPPKKSDDLGLDEEVQVRKKRLVVKLDETRLLSAKGIPKIRKEAPKKLKFKEKGHEYRDAARLLAYYQFWADDLFKKGRFRDTLAIIEKLGHSKSMRRLREEWIQEAKDAKDGRLPADDGPEKELPSRDKATREDTEPNDDELYSRPERLKASQPQEEEDLDALFKGNGAMDDDSDEGMGGMDEDLEELLRAQKLEDAAKSGGGVTRQEALMDAFDDEEEAMAAMMD